MSGILCAMIGSRNAFVPVTSSHLAAGSGTDTIPSFCTALTMENWGASGAVQAVPVVDAELPPDSGAPLAVIARPWWLLCRPTGARPSTGAMEQLERRAWVVEVREAHPQSVPERMQFPPR